MRSRRMVCFFLSAWLLPLLACAGVGPTYRYGEVWWDEYEPDKETELLLHFGPPTITGRKQLTTVVAEKKKEDRLGDDLDLKGDSDIRLKDADLPSVGGELDAKPPVDEKSLPADTIADYSDKRRQIKIGPGCKRGPGRFGGGLLCDGTGRIAVTVVSPAAAECWFRIAAYPQQESCILSLANDEARLLLRPDGRLELRLRKPHGNPNEKQLAPAAIKAILEKPAEIISPEPVPLNTWTHVVIYDLPHPSPGNTAPFDARLKVNGKDVAWYLSEGGNQYNFFGGHQSLLTIGNNADGKQGFKGELDEVRISTRCRDWYEVMPMPWRDAKAERPLRFNRPYFRSDSTVVHASLDKGCKLDLDTAGAGEIALNLHGEKLDGLLVEGIRGKGWLMDPDIGFARVPLKGMNARRGALEWWLRPVNWDDCTGYWHHSPPNHMHLSVARVFGRGQGDGQPIFNIMLPRAFNLERQRIPLDPGHWLHMMLVWDENGWGLFVNGRAIDGRRRNKDANLSIDLAFVEFGIPDKIEAIRREPPRIEIDEVVGYNTPLRADEVAQAQKRWMGEIAAIPLYDATFQYKWSLSKLEFKIIPLLPEGVTPAAAKVALYEAKADKPILAAESASLNGDAFKFVLSEGKPLPYGNYQFRFQIDDNTGKAATNGVLDWDFKEEPWRHCRAGILEKPTPPWTPIEINENILATRMTRYRLAADGLPAEISAAGVNILQGQIRIEEDGKPLAGKIVAAIKGNAVEATWASQFLGGSYDVLMACRLEYDGMIKYELSIKPKGEVRPLAFVIPLKAEHAKRWLAYPVGERGPRTGEIASADGLLLTSRADPAPYKVWRAYQDERKKQPNLAWSAYWESIRRQTEAYGFYTHVDINDLNRGLWWFCDNAIGWQQSKKVGAVEIVRQGEAVNLILNIIAEAGEYQWAKPIIFAILPHPARPLPEKYRVHNKGRPDLDERLCDVYDAFFPWAKDPRGGGSLCMRLFPAPDPKKPEAGPSWEYAESCITLMKAVKPHGLRTMYLSKAWFSCRAGQYDHWEWRSGESGACSLTPWFNNYLCWEMNEWIRRDIWDAIYLDECYEHPARNLEASMSVRLPDGSEQPGVTNFMFRDLIKRWRGIFVQHGKEPFLISHLTYSWQYHGTVFFDSYLDGENRPIVSLNSPDWIDSTSRTQFEVVQNSRLWGLSSFYMPFIAEGGFENKTKSQFLRWQWRMARQAQSQFAHYEVQTVYEGQGAEVYKAYWNDLFSWGAADEKKAEFHPYWDNAKYLETPGQGGDILVSFYKQPGKVLVIASNRKRQEETLRIKLNCAALGLKADAQARDVDSSFMPPPGEDFAVEERESAAKKMREEAEKQVDDFFDDGHKKGEGDLDIDLKGPDALEDPSKAVAAAAEAYKPKMEKETLLIRVRPRDFRLVAVE